MGNLERKINGETLSPLPVITPWAEYGSLTRFSVSDSSKLSTSNLSCQLLTTFSDPLLLPKAFSIWDLWGDSSLNVLNLTQKKPFQWVQTLLKCLPPRKQVPKSALTCWKHLIGLQRFSKSTSGLNYHSQMPRLRSDEHDVKWICLASGHQSSSSFSSLPPLTLMAARPQEKHLVWFMTKWFGYTDYVSSMFLLFKCCCWSYIRG